MFQKPVELTPETGGHNRVIQSDLNLWDSRKKTSVVSSTVPAQDLLILLSEFAHQCIGSFFIPHRQAFVNSVTTHVRTLDTL